MTEMLVAHGPVVARIVMGVFYWVMAAGLVKDFGIVTSLMTEKRVPGPAPLLVITILVWIVGGAMLVTGWNVFPAAIGLFALTLAVTPVIHNFWAAPPELLANEIQHFFKNMAILAGLLCIIAIAAADTVMP